MRIPGLDGEWELFSGDISKCDWKGDLRVIRSISKQNVDTLVIKRIPEKSELEKWAIELNCRASAVAGFRKAIELLENDQSEHMHCSANAVKVLKKFAGMK